MKNLTEEIIKKLNNLAFKLEEDEDKETIYQAIGTIQGFETVASIYLNRIKTKEVIK